DALGRRGPARLHSSVLSRSRRPNRSLSAVIPSALLTPQSWELVQRRQDTLYASTTGSNYHVRGIDRIVEGPLQYDKARSRTVAVAHVDVKPIGRVRSPAQPRHRPTARGPERERLVGLQRGLRRP